MKIELGKEYETRAGREVRIYALEDEGDYPVHGAVFEEGVWHGHSWGADGRWLSFSPDRLDLIEKPKTIKGEVWVNVYESGNHGLNASREGADRCAVNGRIARIRLPFECKEGQFDE